MVDGVSYPLSKDFCFCSDRVPLVGVGKGYLPGLPVSLGLFAGVEGLEFPRRGGWCRLACGVCVSGGQVRVAC